MGLTYLIWSAKAGGWLANGVNYTSTIQADAKEFGRGEALAMCRRQYAKGTATHGLIPVLLDDLNIITGEPL